MIAGAPVIAYGPTSGLGIGFAGNLALYKGVPHTTRISSVVASVIGTTKEQLLVNAKVNGFALDNHWHFEGDNRLYWTSQETFGLGTDTTTDDAVDQKFDNFRFFETLYRKVGKNVYLGGGFLYSNHSQVRPGDDDASTAWPDSPYVAYSEQYGFDPDSQSSAGVSVKALLDSRDGSINPSRGWYANADYRMFFEDFLGGTSNWQQFSYDTEDVLPAVPGRAPQGGVLAHGRLRHRGHRALPRPAGHGDGHLRARRARLPPGPVPRAGPACTGRWSTGGP